MNPLAYSRIISPSWGKFPKSDPTYLQYGGRFIITDRIVDSTCYLIFSDDDWLLLSIPI